MDVKQKRKPTKIEEMTREQIQQAIIKKRECNAKAQKIVESLLEKEISESYFLQCLPEINQSHFDDIIEERCIVHLCGYPLCQTQLLENEIPKQRYRISIKRNKVYDITVRKNFCSNSCYKSAMHIKKQMLTSPLWFRMYEEIPQFKLLPLDSIGSLGQEVDLSMIERALVKPDKENFTPINAFTSASLKDIEIFENNERTSIASNTLSNIGEQKINATNEKNLKILNTNEKIDSKLAITDGKLITNKQIPNPLNIVGEIVENSEKQIDPILVNAPKIDSVKTTIVTVKKQPQRKQPSVIAITIEVEKCLAEWFSIDTLIFIFGENKVKEMVADKGECIKEYLNNYSKSIFYNSNSYDQYKALCRKLNMLELEDRKYDAQTLQREMKPLPDYSILQKESKKMQLKVRAFLSGETEVKESEVTNISTIECTEDNVNPTQLPLVDKNSQNALRRRIVWEHLNKVLPDILRSLNLSTPSISSDMRLLINTFKLKANNIMFKPLQWTLIAIVFIKLLSFKDERLQSLLEQQIAFQHLQLLLLSFKQDGGYLDRLISWLTDIDRLLDVNDTQLTIK